MGMKWSRFFPPPFFPPAPGLDWFNCNISIVSAAAAEAAAADVDHIEHELGTRPFHVSLIVWRQRSVFADIVCITLKGGSTDSGGQFNKDQSLIRIILLCLLTVGWRSLFQMILAFSLTCNPLL